MKIKEASKSNKGILGRDTNKFDEDKTIVSKIVTKTK